MKPQVSKSYLVERFNNGAKVSDVLNDINGTLPEGQKLSEGKLKQAITKFGINLRKKPRQAPVEFIDDSVVESNEVTTTSIVEPITNEVAAEAVPVVEQEFVASEQFAQQVATDFDGL